MKLGCVILAAGRAERFGSNKLLASLGGKPVLAHVLDMLPRQRFEKILAVVSDPATGDLCRDRGISTASYGGGAQSDSIRLGLTRMEGLDGCLFVMGDQPLCTGKSVSRMVDAFLEDPSHVIRLAYGDQQASPVLFPKEAFEAMSRLTGEQGGMVVARNYPIKTVEADSPWELRDTDTPQALAALEAHLSEP